MTVTVTVAAARAAGELECYCQGSSLRTAARLAHRVTGGRFLRRCTQAAAVTRARWAQTVTVRPGLTESKPTAIIRVMMTRTQSDQATNVASDSDSGSPVAPTARTLTEPAAGELSLNSAIGSSPRPGRDRDCCAAAAASGSELGCTGTVPVAAVTRRPGPGNGHDSVQA